MAEETVQPNTDSLEPKKQLRVNPDGDALVEELRVNPDGDALVEELRVKQEQDAIEKKKKKEEEEKKLLESLGEVQSADGVNDRGTKKNTEITLKDDQEPDVYQFPFGFIMALALTSLGPVSVFILPFQAIAPFLSAWWPKISYTSTSEYKPQDLRERADGIGNLEDIENPDARRVTQQICNVFEEKILSQVFRKNGGALDDSCLNKQDFAEACKALDVGSSLPEEKSKKLTATLIKVFEATRGFLISGFGLLEQVSPEEKQKQIAAIDGLLAERDKDPKEFLEAYKKLGMQGVSEFFRKAKKLRQRSSMSI